MTTKPDAQGIQPARRGKAPRNLLSIIHVNLFFSSARLAPS
jgi:hypothetical protein